MVNFNWLKMIVWIIHVAVRSVYFYCDKNQLGSIWVNLIPRAIVRNAELYLCFVILLALKTLISKHNMNISAKSIQTQLCNEKCI